MDALWEWIEFVGTLSWLGHGCSVGMDRVCGWSLWERYHGCHMDALREWIEFVGTLPGLPHGCSVGMDRVCGNVIMVATWMLCRNGSSLWERYHGCHMDALREWMEFVGTLSWLPHGCSVGMDRVCGNVIIVATWMLCRNRWSLWERYQGYHMDALRAWMKTDLDVITVGK